jgi:hypothetical protein
MPNLLPLADEAKDWISLEDAAAHCRVSTKTVRGWAHAGTCVWKHGDHGELLISRAHLDERLRRPGNLPLAA